MNSIDGLKYLKDLKKFKIYLNKKDPGISRTLKKFNFKTQWPREPEFMYLFHKKINPETSIIDLGANIGYLTLYFKKVLNVKKKIMSIEPEFSNYLFLKENIKLNDLENEVICKNLAIAEKDGDKYFEISNHSNLHKLTQKITTNKIKCKTLTTLLKEENFKPDFIKMDVEGAEIEVVNGFREYLKSDNHRISILFEVHPNDYNEKRSFNEELNFLFSNGFVTEYLITAGTQFPNFFKEKGYSPDASFRSGKFKRYIIKNVKNEDVISSLNNSIYYPEINSLKNMIKSLKIYSYSKKIVRGILLTRT